MSDFTIFDNEEMANGDPVCAVAHNNDGEPSLASLGTGFSSWSEVRHQLEYVIQTGEATRYINNGAARKLEGADSIDVFTMSAELVMKYE